MRRAMLPLCAILAAFAAPPAPAAVWDRWPDRRAIGAVYLAQEASGWPAAARALNPRGWFGDRDRDYVSTGGRTAFRAKLLGWADNTVRICRSFGAQAVIVWDVEGQEHPHPVSYLGEPRSLPPEMDAAADAFFARLRSAGLRVGVTIRLQQVVRYLYHPVFWQIELEDGARWQNTIDKVDEARRRWGCRLFYLDSNGGASTPAATSVIAALANRYPDSLFIPEHAATDYAPHAAEYHDFPSELRTGTSQSVLRIYPRAFSAVYAPEGPLSQYRPALTAAFRRGDALLFRAWFDDASHGLLKQILRDAGRL